jgi:hypothetical protein
MVVSTDTAITALMLGPAPVWQRSTRCVSQYLELHHLIIERVSDFQTKLPGRSHRRPEGTICGNGPRRPTRPRPLANSA